MQRELAEADPNFGQPKDGRFDPEARQRQRELLREVINDMTIQKYQYIICHPSGTHQDKAIR